MSEGFASEFTLPFTSVPQHFDYTVKQFGMVWEEAEAGHEQGLFSSPSKVTDDSYFTRTKEHELLKGDGISQCSPTLFDEPKTSTPKLNEDDEPCTQGCEFDDCPTDKDHIMLKIKGNNVMLSEASAWADGVSITPLDQAQNYSIHTKHPPPKPIDAGLSSDSYDDFSLIPTPELNEDKANTSSCESVDKPQYEDPIMTFHKGEDVMLSEGNNPEARLDSWSEGTFLTSLDQTQVSLIHVKDAQARPVDPGPIHRRKSPLLPRPETQPSRRDVIFDTQKEEDGIKEEVQNKMLLPGRKRTANKGQPSIKPAAPKKQKMYERDPVKYPEAKNARDSKTRRDRVKAERLEEKKRIADLTEECQKLKTEKKELMIANEMKEIEIMKWEVKYKKLELDFQGFRQTTPSIPVLLPQYSFNSFAPGMNVQLFSQGVQGQDSQTQNGTPMTTI